MFSNFEQDFRKYWKNLRRDLGKSGLGNLEKILSVMEKFPLLFVRNFWTLTDKVWEIFEKILGY